MSNLDEVDYLIIKHSLEDMSKSLKEQVRLIKEIRELL